MILLLRLLAYIPLPILYLLAYPLFIPLYYLPGYRRKLVRENLEAAFPEKSTKEIIRIEKAAYRHFLDVAVESLKSPQLSSEFMRSRYKIENAEAILKHINANQPVLLLSAHQGNWEWLAQILGQELDCEVAVVYKALHNEAMNKHMSDVRTRYGIKLIEFHDAAKDIFENREKPRVFGMLADQAPGRRDNRAWLNYLNRPAPFYLGPQMIGEVVNCPVLYIHASKLSRGHYHVVFEELCEPPYQTRGSDVLEAYRDALENSIRQQPESFLWTNNKWRPPRDDEQAAYEAAKR